MALTVEQLHPLLERLKQDIRVDIVNIIKTQLKSFGALSSEQNDKIKNLQKENVDLRKMVGS